jgi:hypothetical protein
MKFMLIILLSVPFVFSGCIVGTVASLPFKAVGAVTKVVAPDAIGDGISGIGTVVDAAIPF